MSGKVIRILERTLYNFPAGKMPSGSSSIVVVAQNVDVSQYLYVQVVLRVHSFLQSAGGTATNAKMQLDCYRSAPTAEDPGLTFRETAALASLSPNYTWVTGATNAGVVVVSGANGTVGETIDVVLTASQASPTTSDLTVMLSADLVLKS